MASLIFVVIYCQKYPFKRTAIVVFKPYLGGDKEIHIFVKGIISKVKIIERLVFELVYFKDIVQHFSIYTTIYLQYPVL